VHFPHQEKQALGELPARFVAGEPQPLAAAEIAAAKQGQTFEGATFLDGFRLPDTGRSSPAGWGRHRRLTLNKFGDCVILVTLKLASSSR
jgi:hypothetical protein